MSVRPHRILAAMLAALPAIVPGCATEERVIYRTPRLLENIPGVQEGGEDLAAKKAREEARRRSEADRGAQDRVTSDSLDQSRVDPALAREAAAEPEDKLVTLNPDQTVTLNAANYREVIALLSRALNTEPELQGPFFDQIVHSSTKANFREAGQDPREEVWKFLTANRAHVNRLLSRFPGGENSPGVMVSIVGRNRFKLEVTGTGAKGLKFTELWVGIEESKPKFIWVR
jgi:hypothetical protein